MSSPVDSTASAAAELSSVTLHQAFPQLWPRLLAMRQHGRIAHAYLLVGDDAELLEAAARAWGALCACHAPTSAGRPCGSCPPCRSFATGRYREAYELRPQSKSRQILVEEMRDFEHQLNLTAAPGCLKIGMVVEADRLNEQAQNAFLKTLEEPPANLMLVLLTTSPKLLLPTIRSRCQTLSLRRNRRRFPLLEHVDIRPILARLQRGAGAAVGLEGAARLLAACRQLGQMAEEGQAADDDDPSLVDQDAGLKKRLEEQRAARLQADYLRLRSQLCAMIESWFQQRYLAALGMAAGELPNPELAATPPTDGAVLALEADFLEAGRLSRFLDSNIDERLAFEAFCLAICRKSQS